jgi:hypothetical protein
VLNDSSSPVDLSCRTPYDMYLGDISFSVKICILADDLIMTLGPAKRANFSAKVDAQDP